MDVIKVTSEQIEANYMGLLTDRDKHSISDSDPDVISTGLQRFNSRYKAYIQDESE